jgi:polysaccharide chain length determinant protein (PEP-CTERM system associated)
MTVLPGKTYTTEDLLKILWQHKWLVVFPFVMAMVSTVAVSLVLPKKYRSETTILVVPQRVPESYVRATVTTRIEDRLSSLREQILSRSRLERIVYDFNLYPDLRQKAPMEDVIEAMRHNVEITVQRGDAFKVSFVSGEPRVAQKVAERLASLFIEENLRDREVQAEGTNQFLDSQLEEARRRLVEHEKKLEEYRRRYAGQLPTQVQTNLQAIQNVQLQLQALNESMNHDRDRRLIVERQLTDLEAAGSAASAPVDLPPRSSDPPSISNAQLLDAAQARLRALQLHYTDEHPDVAAAKRQIRELEAKVQAEQSTATTTQAPVTQPLTAGEALRQSRIRDFKAELRNIDAQLARKQADERQLQEAVASYQVKVDAAPTRESELTELTRDYTTLQSAYTSLLTKREDSKVAANLERRQVGEQFKVLDPARVPERPFSPNVRLINSAGAVLGLGIGVLLIGFLEYRDSSLRTEDDVVRVIQLPVLAVVPIMASERDLRLHRRRQLLVGLAVFVLMMSAGAAVLLWKFPIL